MSYIYDLTDTWNAAGTLFNAVKMNVTNTASAANSRLITLQVNGSEKFSVDKDGAGYFSGNVGIGTSSVDTYTKFQVVESSSSRSWSSAAGISTLLVERNGNTGITLSSAATSSGYLNFASPTDENAGIIQYNHSANAMTFRTNGSGEAMRIDSSGNLGLGTSSPIYTLDVNSGVADTVARFVSSDTNAFLDIRDATTSAGYVRFGAVGNDSVLWAGNAERMRIDSSGNVGIGTSSPNNRLSVSGDLFIQAASTGQNTQTIRALSGQTGNLFQWQNSGGTVLGVINSSGNLGIGTSSVDTYTKFQVVESSSSRSWSSSAGFSTLLVERNGNTGITLSSAATSSGYLNFASPTDENAGIIQYNHSANAMTFRTNGSGEAMRIDSIGNVGIGTSSPSDELHVNNTSGNCLSTITSSDSGTAGIQFGDQSDNNAGYIYYNNTSDYMSFRTNGTGEDMRIDSSGNVGIGTSSPDRTLHVASTSSLNTRLERVGSAGGAGIEFENTAGTFAVFGTPTGSGTGAFVPTGSGVDFGSASNQWGNGYFAGNVGIGTSSPGAQLHAVGGQIFERSGGILTYFKNPSATDAAYGIFSLETTNSGSVYFRTRNSSGSLVSNDYLIDRNASGATSHAWRIGNTERMRISSTGIFFVNTTATPTFGLPKMVVDGNISGKGTVTVNSSTATTIAEGAGLLLLIRDTTYGGTAVVSYENAHTPVIISTSGTSFQTSAPTGSAQFQLTSKSGNLGVAALASGDRNGAVLAVTVLQTFG